MKSIVLLNDTSNAHAGCKLVIKAIDAICSKFNWNIIYRHYCGQPLTPESLPKNDLVIVNGEGTLHHGRGSSLVHVAQYHKSVLINTVYQDNTYTREDLRKFHLISARESLSAKEINDLGVECLVVPDLSLYNHLSEAYTPVEDALLLDSVVRPVNPLAIRLPSAVDKAVALISQYKRVCTGRFHGMLIAALLNRPFSCYPSNTHKTIGVLKDMGCSNLYFNSPEEALQNLPQKADPKTIQYIETARSKIEDMFNKIAII